MELVNDRGLLLIAYAPADRPSEDALRLLASWSATAQPEDAVNRPR